MPQARRVPADVDRAVALCRTVAAGGAGHLRIGSSGAALNSVTPVLVRGLLDRRPGLAIQLTQMDTPIQLAALRAGEIDLGVVRSAGPATGVQLEDLLTEPLMPALPAAHPLVRNEVVSAGELRDEPFVLWPRATNHGGRRHTPERGHLPVPSAWRRPTCCGCAPSSAPG